MSDDTIRLFAQRPDREVNAALPQTNAGRQVLVGRITTATASIAVGKFFYIQPQVLTGPESEGGTGTLTDKTTQSVPVYNLGPGGFSSGDVVLAKFVRDRWVAGRKGASGPSYPFPGNCSCPGLPTTTITMDSLNTTCNFGMFQDATLEYMTVPAGLAGLGIADLAGKAWLSNATFTEPVTGDVFRYWFYCLNSKFSLTRVYETSIFGSPFREGELYFWMIGNPGNTCSPFSFSNGSPFLGSELTCDVDLSA